jgi:hypothetical protein
MRKIPRPPTKLQKAFKDYIQGVITYDRYKQIVKEAKKEKQDATINDKSTAG